MAAANRGAQWEWVLREAVPDVGPWWTLTGRGARATLTWGRVGWVWQHIGLDLKSGSVHELCASRTWTDVPLSRTIDALAQDLVPESSPDRLFDLSDPDAAAQVRRWAALVPEATFARSLEQDLGWFEWRFEQYLTSGRRVPWMPLAGLRVVFERDPRPVVDAALELLSRTGGSVRRSQEDPWLGFWHDFSVRLDGGRDATLAWLDEHRRAALREERVPENLIDPVLDGTEASG